MALQRVRIAKKELLQKENEIGGLTPPDLKTYYKAIAITTMWSGVRIAIQTKGIELSSEIDPYVCGQVTFDRVSGPLNGQKNSLFNRWYWDNWIFTSKRIKLDPSLMSYTKIHSKCFSDLGENHETLRRKHWGVNLHDFGTLTPKA